MRFNILSVARGLELIRLVDRAREPHIQPQDHLWRELPRATTIRPVHLAGQPSVRQPGRREGRSVEITCPRTLEPEQQHRDGPC